MRRIALCFWIAGLLAGPARASAEKLEGVVWDRSPLVVEGIEVVVTPETRLERKGHPNLTPQELRIGWEVEVEGRVEGDRLVSRKIKVKTERRKKVDVEGHIESLGEDSFDVEGRHVRYGGVDRSALAPGMFLYGKGILIDDGTIELEKYELDPLARDKGEVAFLTMAAAELEQLKKNLETSTTIASSRSTSPGWGTASFPRGSTAAKSSSLSASSTIRI